MAFENLKSTGITYLLNKLKDHFLQIKDAVKTVNGNEPDANGDIAITTVPYAQNLESESSHRSNDTFIQRTTGGDSSVSNGDAWLVNIKGNSVHTGYTAESIDMTVNATGETPITATLDRDTFVSYVSQSGTITLTYTTAWSADPTDYGITVTGTPENGDSIVVVYVKEVRGTITVANPTSFVSTGWNLFDYANGYAKVVKYEYGYRITGAYTALKFSTTPTGTQTSLSVVDGAFDIPSDGYVHVTGGDQTSTAIYATWQDWASGYGGAFEAYSASTVDLATIMATYFPYGLLKAGSVVDELDLNLGQTISRVERMTYTAENLATARASGREYEYDEDYIYLARAAAVTNTVTIDGAVSSNDHGIEYFAGTTIGIVSEILYGDNLKNKLERDVLTISSQLLTSSQQAQVLSNLGIDFGVVKFGKDASSWTWAQFVADISGYSTGDIIIYRLSPAIGTQLFTTGSTSLNYMAIINKASSDNAYYFMTGRGASVNGNIALGTGVATLYWSSEATRVLNTSSTIPDKTIPSGADTDVGYFDIPAGDYVIIITANFASNATGYRSIWLSETAGGTQINLASRAIASPVSGVNTRFQLPVTYSTSTAKRLYVVAYQNSGSSLAMNTRYAIARVK